MLDLLIMCHYAMGRSPSTFNIEINLVVVLFQVAEKRVYQIGGTSPTEISG